ncbi:MAG TPA: response regulator transcription factor [Kouleothrix sp.]|uniref:response regulator n=1 Tax=Kouleothrix sp. TaxID=2779161 RepID=UPI002BAE4A6B|nr:response regulator transcription factor [Kouleothrix sp.]HRC75946.1 response regulator transcription factor [Kouleothrix sp.]
MTQDDQPGIIRIIVADDHLLYRRGVCAVLEPFVAQVHVVGEASTAEETLAQARQRQPDLVLLDLRMPQRSGVATRPAWEHGVEAIGQLRTLARPPRVLVMSYIDEPKVLFAALRAGAHGYINKGDSYDGAPLVDAICRTVGGEAIYGPLVAQLIRDYHQREQESLPPAERLTPRERDVLELLAERKSNQEIAKELVIGIKTVKTHVASILAKLHLNSRHEIPTYVRLHNGGKQQ